MNSHVETATTPDLLTRIGSIKPLHDFYSLTFISLRNQYVYVAVGKAANSTVKHVLFTLEYEGTRFTTRSVHDRQSAPLVSPFQLPPQLLNDALLSPSYFRFAIVRHPYTRLLSCYLDRIQRKAGGAYKQIVRQMNINEGDPISFPDFIYLICSQTPYQQNAHWRLQKAELLMDVVTYDFIGKQEQFASDMLTIWSKIAPRLPAPDFVGTNKSPSTTSANARIDDYYTHDLKTRVLKAYAEDFCTFEYSPDLNIC
jgi:hypothetical protein